MRTITVAAASLALVLTLSACTSTPPADTGKIPDTQPAASSTPTPSAATGEFGDVVKSSRGNLVKTTGQLAGTSGMGTDVVTSRFAVTDIVLDRPCSDEYSNAPANGHYLAIHLNIETTPELADEAFAWVSFSQYDWQAYDAEGKRLNDSNGNAWSCLGSSERLPSQIGPGQSVSGWIVLDVASPTGVIALTMAGSPVGWEWSY